MAIWGDGGQSRDVMRAQNVGEDKWMPMLTSRIQAPKHFNKRQMGKDTFYVLQGYKEGYHWLKAFNHHYPPFLSNNIPIRHKLYGIKSNFPVSVTVSVSKKQVL